MRGSNGRHRWWQTAAAVCLALTVSGNASADSCSEQIAALAERYKLDVTTADAIPEELLPDDGTQPEGMVLEPPPTGDPAVIEPPEDLDSAMPTVPDVTPDDEERGSAEAESLSAADRAALETILMSAQNEADTGDEERCFETFQQALDYLDSAHSG